MKPWRIIALFIGVMAVALLITSPALASERITGGNVTIDEDVDDDLYITGETVVVNATIDGDLLVFAKSLTLNGTVTGDLIFGGQWLVINGTVEDDLRAGGMNLIISDGGMVQDDVNAGAYAYEMQPGSSVGGDVYFGAAQALVTDVAGTVMGGGNSLRVDGTVGGDVLAGVGDPEESFMMNPSSFYNDPSVPVVSQLPAGLSFGPKAKVGGDLSYSSNASVSIPDGVVAGSVQRSMQSSTSSSEEEVSEPETGGGIPAIAKYLGYVLGSFIMLMVVGWVLQRIAPNFLNGTLDTLRLRTLASFGAGFLGYLVVYIIVPMIVALVILLVILPLAGTDLRLIGILGLLGLGTFTTFTFITNWLAPILMALLIGTWLTRLIGREAVPSKLASMALGLAILVVVMAIPFVGRFLLTLIIGMMGLGALLIYLWPRGAAVVVDPAKTPPPDRTVSMEPTGV